MKILFVTPPTKFASTRLRVENYFPYLKPHNYKQLIGDPDWAYRRKLQFGLKLLYESQNSDVVFIHKLLLPKLLFKYISLNSRVIFDYDDALYADRPWHDDDSTNLRRHLNYTLKLSDIIISSTPEIENHSSKFNSNIYRLPTTLKREKYRKLRARTTKINQPTIGWIGHPENLYYLRENKNKIQKVLEQTDSSLRIITSESNRFSPFLDHPHVEYIEWSKETADYRLSECHIAIRPLINDRWTRGKCHSSVIQAMALGIPVVTSPVGILNEVVGNSSAGYLADSEDEWVDRIDILLRNDEHRQNMSENAVKRVGEIDFWTDNQSNKFVDIISNND